MLIFFLLCTAMVVLALWFVLPPLMQKDEDRSEDELRANNVSVYRDQYQELEADLRNGLISPAQYQQDKDEIERRLLEDVSATNESRSPVARLALLNQKLVYGIVAAIPVAALSLYLGIGNPKALNPQSASPAPDSMTQSQIEANVAKLAKRLEQNPDDAPGWSMLARSYMSMERYRDAAGAFEHLTSLSPNDADAWASRSRRRIARCNWIRRTDRRWFCSPARLSRLTIIRSRLTTGRSFCRCCRRILKQRRRSQIRSRRRSSWLPAVLRARLARKQIQKVRTGFERKRLCLIHNEKPSIVATIQARAVARSDLKAAKTKCSMPRCSTPSLSTGTPKIQSYASRFAAC